MCILIGNLVKLVELYYFYLVSLLRRTTLLSWTQHRIELFSILPDFCGYSMTSNAISLLLLCALRAFDQSLDLRARKLASGHPILEQDVEFSISSAFGFRYLEARLEN